MARGWQNWRTALAVVQPDTLSDGIATGSAADRPDVRTADRAAVHLWINRPAFSSVRWRRRTRCGERAEAEGAPNAVTSSAKTDGIPSLQHEFSAVFITSTGWRQSRRRLCAVVPPEDRDTSIEGGWAELASAALSLTRRTPARCHGRRCPKRTGIAGNEFVAIYELRSRCRPFPSSVVVW